jgi:hypothetical protein
MRGTNNAIHLDFLMRTLFAIFFLADFLSTDEAEGLGLRIFAIEEEAIALNSGLEVAAELEVD